MEVIATVGISGSGKTTWAKNYVAHHTNWILIDTDEIRGELWGNPADQQHGEMVFQVAYERTREALKMGYNVIFCATSIRLWMRNQLKRILPKNTNLTFAWINTNIATALARNAARERIVPPQIIYNQCARFQMFESTEKYFVVNTEGEENYEVCC